MLTTHALCPALCPLGCVHGRAVAAEGTVSYPWSMSAGRATCRARRLIWPPLTLTTCWPAG